MGGITTAHHELIDGVNDSKVKHTEIKYTEEIIVGYDVEEEIHDVPVTLDFATDIRNLDIQIEDHRDGAILGAQSQPLIDGHERVDGDLSEVQATVAKRLDILCKTKTPDFRPKLIQAITRLCTKQAAEVIKSNLKRETHQGAPDDGAVWTQHMGTYVKLKNVEEPAYRYSITALKTDDEGEYEYQATIEATWEIEQHSSGLDKGSPISNLADDYVSQYTVSTTYNLQEVVDQEASWLSWQYRKSHVGMQDLGQMAVARIRNRVESSKQPISLSSSQ